LPIFEKKGKNEVHGSFFSSLRNPASFIKRWMIINRKLGYIEEKRKMKGGKILYN